ncbi:M12 family metallopeptidase [Chishuiella changwenlii]|uniref:M12 family metallopeptidase n=1 Tax=Chishuiella changwenlii TaxID=1434701 RepID=UPI002FD96695
MKKLMNQKERLGSILLKGILCTVVLLSSCDTNDDNNEKLEKQVVKEELKKGFFLGEEIIYVRKDGKNIFQGDMLITDEQLNENKQNRAAVRRSLRWPNRTVYYTFSKKLMSNDNKDLLYRVYAAIRDFKTETNVIWEYRSDYTPSCVTFDTNGRAGDSGFATVGNQRGVKYISLNNEASYPTIIHEMGHTIGLYHEQSRNDRDNHITINWHNIENGFRHNFEKMSGIVDIGPFDVNSIMMYHSYSYSKNNQPTIVLKDGNTFGHNYIGFTQNDINAINRMYPR